jgi:hypothetical protein
MTVEKLLDSLNEQLAKIKVVFLSPDYDDDMHGWIVEDHLNYMQNAINDYKNQEFKHSEPDPFA